MYLEDVDFCAAIRARGRRILFVPTVEVTHPAEDVPRRPRRTRHALHAGVLSRLSLPEASPGDRSSSCDCTLSLRNDLPPS